MVMWDVIHNLRLPFQTLDRAENRRYDVSKESVSARRARGMEGGRLSLVIDTRARCRSTGSRFVWSH
jgi:hypothetical protein